MAWVSRLADWAAYNDPLNGHWNGTAWELTSDYSGQGEVFLDATGQAWATGYRPTQMRVTIDITTTAPVFYVFPALFSDEFSLINNAILTGYSGSHEYLLEISGQSGDIVTFYVYHTSMAATNVKVTGIEFTEDLPTPHGTIEIEAECIGDGIGVVFVYGVAEIEAECIGYGIGVGTISRDGECIVEAECLGGVFLPATGTAEIEVEAIAVLTALPPTIAKQLIGTKYLLGYKGYEKIIEDRTLQVTPVVQEGNPLYNGYYENNYWRSISGQGNGILLIPTNGWNSGYRRTSIIVDFNFVHDDSKFVYSDRSSIIVSLSDSTFLIRILDYTCPIVFGRNTIEIIIPEYITDISYIGFAATWEDYGYDHSDCHLEIYSFKFAYTTIGPIHILPISSLSVSSRSGTPSSINSVIPFTVEYSDTVNSLSNATIYVNRIQDYSDGTSDDSLIEHGDLTGLQIDIGPKNASIILTGTSTKTNRAAKFVELNGLQYVATVNGKKRIRCTPSNDLTVGDTVQIEGHTLIANNIQLNVTASLESMEVYE